MIFAKDLCSMGSFHVRDFRAISYIFRGLLGDLALSSVRNWVSIFLVLKMLKLTPVDFPVIRVCCTWFNIFLLLESVALSIPAVCLASSFSRQRMFGVSTHILLLDGDKAHLSVLELSCCCMLSGCFKPCFMAYADYCIFYLLSLERSCILHHPSMVIMVIMLI